MLEDISKMPTYYRRYENDTLTIMTNYQLIIFSWLLTIAILPSSWPWRSRTTEFFRFLGHNCSINLLKFKQKSTSNQQKLAFCFITRAMLIFATSAAYWKPCLTVLSASLPTGPTFPRNVIGLKWYFPDWITQTSWLITLSWLILLLIKHLINQLPDYQLLPTGKILFALSCRLKTRFLLILYAHNRWSESENAQNHPACVYQPEDQWTPEITRSQTAACKPTIPCLPIQMWSVRCRLCWLYPTALRELVKTTILEQDPPNHKMVGDVCLHPPYLTSKDGVFVA